MSKDAKGLFVGAYHDRGGIPSKIVETNQQIEIEGDEYYICREAYNSPKKFSYSNKSNKEILDDLYQNFSCKLVQSAMNAGDFIVCKLVVLDNSKHNRRGTVKQIVNEMQGEKACRVENGSSHKKYGGGIAELNKMVSESDYEGVSLPLTLEDGGGVSPHENYWNELGKWEKFHFLDDHADQLKIRRGSEQLDKYAIVEFKQLPKNLRVAIRTHFYAPKYSDGGSLIYHVTNCDLKRDANNPMHFGTLKQAENRCEALNYGNDAQYYVCEINPNWKVLETSDLVANKFAKNPPKKFEYDAIKYPNQVEGEGFSYVIFGDADVKPFEKGETAYDKWQSGREKVTETEVLGEVAKPFHNLAKGIDSFTGGRSERFTDPIGFKLKKMRRKKSKGGNLPTVSPTYRDGGGIEAVNLKIIPQATAIYKGKKGLFPLVKVVTKNSSENYYTGKDEKSVKALQSDFDKLKNKSESELQELFEKHGFEYDNYAKGGKVKRRGVKGDLSKLSYFQDAYRGAEFYSLQDKTDDFYKEYIVNSDRWFDLMVKNQKGNGLTANEYKEFKSLSLSILKSDEYTKGGSVSDEVYIDYRNKDKNYKTDRKSFKSYDDAVKWARKEFESFNPDMIGYYDKGGEIKTKYYNGALAFLNW